MSSASEMRWLITAWYAVSESSWLWAVRTWALSTSLLDTEPTSNSALTRRSSSRASRRAPVATSARRTDCTTW